MVVFSDMSGSVSFSIFVFFLFLLNFSDEYDFIDINFKGIRKLYDDL